MKGVILAGGKGTRLFPLTAVTNKHLVPVGNLPMIEYPLFTLKKMGIDDISIVTGGEHFQSIAGYLANMHPEINFSYHYQQKAGGIAQALLMAEPSSKNQKIAVILGDNLFEEDFYRSAQSFENEEAGTRLFLKAVENPQRFGVAEVEGYNIVSIEEKPKKPKSNLAVTGLYFYDEDVFDRIRTLKPSARGEIEITDVNNLYVEEKKAKYSVLNWFWSDAGTIESRKRCGDFVSKGLEDAVISSFPEETRKLLPKKE